MQRRVSLRRIDSLTFKLTAAMALFTVALLAVVGGTAYPQLERAYRLEAQRDLVGLTQELRDRLTADYPDFSEARAYLYDHRDDIVIPMDFDESERARLAFERGFAEAFPGKLYPDDVPFSALTEDLRRLRAVYCQEAWILAFERVRDNFGLPCAYLILPESAVGRVSYLVGPKRRGGAVYGDTHSLLIGEVVGAPRETNPLFTTALESGATQAGACALDTKYGSDYTCIAPMVKDGESLGLVCAGMDLSPMTRRALIATLLHALPVLGVALLCEALLAAFIHRRYVERLARLSDRVEEYADSKSAAVADAIEAEATGRDEVATLSHLLACVIRELRNPFENIESITGELSDTREKAALLNLLANTDSLTGLNNKMAYNEALAQLEREITDGTAAFTIVMIDLNFLKRINDIDGHEKGDMALCRLADQIRAAFPNCGKYRIGGDEFVVILKRVASMNAPTLVEGFLKRLEEDRSPDPWEHISAAVGYWAYGQEGAVTVEDIFERADREMYAHKAAMKAMRTD